MAVGFDNPKVTIFIQDGGEFVKERKESYDVIITDSTDPVGSKYSLVHGEVVLFSEIKMYDHYGKET